MAERETEKIISAADADRLIAAHDAETALLALYLARSPGADDETAAAVLCRTRAEIASAREKLARILRPGTPPAEPRWPENEPIEYPANEIASAAEREPVFASLVGELARILGTTPSRAYLNVLLDAYDHLGMPPEVIMLLLNHCDAEIRRRWGSQRRPTARYISEEAYRWANREILTLELAEEFIARCEKRRADKIRVAELLGIRDRDLSTTESKYVESWLEMGFTDETLAAALDRTLTNTGSLKWAYMNGILKNWHAKGIHTAEELERSDERRAPARAGRGRIEQVDEDELARTIGRIMGDQK